MARARVDELATLEAGEGQRSVREPSRFGDVLERLTLCRADHVDHQRVPGHALDGRIRPMPISLPQLTSTTEAPAHVETCLTVHNRLAHFVPHSVVVWLRGRH